MFARLAHDSIPAEFGFEEVGVAVENAVAGAEIHKVAATFFVEDEEREEILSRLGIAPFASSIRRKLS
jgi:hypothetical protein